jgi:hypothetical protein
MRWYWWVIIALGASVGGVAVYSLHVLRDIFRRLG